MDFNTYAAQNNEVLRNVDNTVLDAFLERLLSLRESRGVLWVAGNGGSSATASHAVADFTKTSTQNGAKPIRAYALSEMVSLQTAFANDNSFTDAMSDTLRLVSEPRDALLIFSVSGRSPNLIKAAEFSLNAGLPVLSIVGSKGHHMSQLSTHSIVLSSEDYQVVENVHVSLMHWLVKEASKV